MSSVQVGAFVKTNMIVLYVSMHILMSIRTLEVGFVDPLMLLITELNDALMWNGQLKENVWSSAPRVLCVNPVIQ